MTHNAIVCRHDGSRAGLFDRNLERSEVDLPQDSIVDLHIVALTGRLGFVADKVLETCLPTATLNACSDVASVKSFTFDLRRIGGFAHLVQTRIRTFRPAMGLRHSFPDFCLLEGHDAG